MAQGPQADLDALGAEIERLRATLDQVGAYVFTKDLQGRYTFANAMVCQLFGRPLDQILGSTDEAFFDLTLSNELRQHDRRVLDQGETVESEETTVIAASGKTRIYWTVKRPLRDAAGRVAGLCGISTDITERLALESRLQQKKQLLDTVLDHVDACVYMKDRERRYLYMNPQTAAMFGISQAEGVGKFDRELLPEARAAEFERLDARLFDSGEKVAGEESFLTRDGELRHFWSTKIPLRIDGVVSACVGISSDITEVIQLRERFEQLANTDALTGISSRRHWMAGAEAELKRMRRAGHSLALALFDVDAFKGINDRHGHAIGDRALIAVVEACRRNLREIDGFGRLGGDEFVLCLPQVDEAGALRVVERLREAIAASSLLAADGALVPISCSFGLALSTAAQSLEELLSRADAALYQAKLAGRNCVRVADSA